MVVLGDFWSPILERVREVELGHPSVWGESNGKLVHTVATPAEAADFLESKALRLAIHARERGRCFYCQRRTTPLVRCLDHVVPLARRGRTSCRNLVSCCLECNSQKGERPAADFLRWLYRERRLTAAELTGRLRSLDALASGKLPPPLPAPAKPAGN